LCIPILTNPIPEKIIAFSHFFKIFLDNPIFSGYIIFNKFELNIRSGDAHIKKVFEPVGNDRFFDAE